MNKFTVFLIVAATSLTAMAQIQKCNYFGKETQTSNSILQLNIEQAMLNMQNAQKHSGQKQAAINSVNKLSKQSLQTSLQIISALDCYEKNKLITFSASMDQSIEKIQQDINMEREIADYASDKATQSAVNTAFAALIQAKAADVMISSIRLVKNK